jgi:hypothetical protein
MNIQNQSSVPTSTYIATIIYESSSDSADYEPLFEESLLAIKATSEEEAMSRVTEYVANSIHSYKNQYGETITWSFKQLERVQPALSDTLPDGEEIFSRFFRDFAAYQATFLGNL